MKKKSTTTTQNTLYMMRIAIDGNIVNEIGAYI